MPFVKSFQAGAVQNTPVGNIFTFLSQPIGLSSVDRIVVVEVYLNQGANNKTATATINFGGVPVAMNSGIQGFNVSETCAIFWYLVGVGNTTANIVITVSGVTSACGISIYSLIGGGGIAPTVLDSATSIAAAPTKNLTTQVGGISFAVGGTRGSTSWTPTNITEDFDNNTLDGPGTISGNCSEDSATSRNVTLTPAASSIPIGAFMSFQAPPSIPFTDRQWEIPDFEVKQVMYG